MSGPEAFGRIIQLFLVNGDARAVSNLTEAAHRLLLAREHFSKSLKNNLFPTTVHRISIFINDGTRSRSTGNHSSGLTVASIHGRTGGILREPAA